MSGSATSARWPRARRRRESVRAIGEWCEAEGVDAWFRQAGFVETSTSAAQDPVIDEILAAAAAVARPAR